MTQNKGPASIVKCPSCGQDIRVVKNIREDHFVDGTRWRCPGSNGAHYGAYPGKREAAGE
jgi:hypothetical protein